MVSWDPVSLRLSVLPKSVLLSLLGRLSSLHAKWGTSRSRLLPFLVQVKQKRRAFALSSWGSLLLVLVGHVLRNEPVAKATAEPRVK